MFCAWKLNKSIEVLVETHVPFQDSKSDVQNQDLYTFVTNISL